MTTDPKAHITKQHAAEAGAPDDYDAILAAVSETPRGRWFLGEYARRNRTADTALVLGEISRLENLLALQHPQMAANRFHAGLHDLATVLALPPDGQGEKQREGLTPEVIAGLALAIGQSGEKMRDALLTARGAAISWREHPHDGPHAARFQDALERQLKLIDEQAGNVLHSAARVEALAQVIAQLRERLRFLLQAGVMAPAAAPAPEMMPVPTPLIATALDAGPGAKSAAADNAMEEKADAAAQPLPAFEQVWHVPPAPSHARLRHIAALMQDDQGDGPETDLLLEDNPLAALAQSARTAHAGRTLAELDRLSYTERAALFA